MWSLLALDTELGIDSDGDGKSEWGPVQLSVHRAPGSMKGEN